MPHLFSYGTLQDERVQLKTYGRRLDGQRDELVGFEPALVEIADHEVAARPGEDHHDNVAFNASDASRVVGMVFEVSDAELLDTDAYEAPSFYQRVTATLASGRHAWVYVHARAVRRAVLGDEPILRALRLQALTDAPGAFGSTYERELARTPADWQRWLSPGATFVLEGSDGPCGIVACARDTAEAADVELMAMWVNPIARGCRDGDALVAAVLAWAKAEGATVVRLKVVPDNQRARRFYERNRFRLTGAHTVRARDGQIELLMEHVIEV